MAKLDDMFDKLGGAAKAKQANKTDKENVPVLSNSNTETKNVIVKSNNDTEQNKVSMKVKSEKDEENESELSNNKSFIDSFLEKKKKATVEDTHTRQTFLIHNDLLKRMNKAARGRERGFKTALVNEAIKRILDEIEAK
ncbi:hypothetical protein [Aneurinibacillus danicus]|uniref:Uncharacterized protein n=1 Tax=Aneurinibacillus danicus TaxID=267746 RepID=A0A511VDB4_9BACL|nr:hypothetical protein [Aneurinibacillus danicus]GEN35938.1 hypothetical protein ADA01nite_33980 [Aneurinibacillus danicus]